MREVEGVAVVHHVVVLLGDDLIGTVVHAEAAGREVGLRATIGDDTALVLAAFLDEVTVLVTLDEVRVGVHLRPDVDALDLIVLHLVHSTPTDEVLIAHAFASELTAALAADAVERLVHGLPCGEGTPVVGGAVDVGLLAHIRSRDRLVNRARDAGTLTQGIPVLTRVGVERLGQLVARLDVVEVSLGGAQDGHTRDVVHLRASTHGGVVVVVLALRVARDVTYLRLVDHIGELVGTYLALLRVVEAGSLLIEEEERQALVSVLLDILQRGVGVATRLGVVGLTILHQEGLDEPTRPARVGPRDQLVGDEVHDAALLVVLAPQQDLRVARQATRCEHLVVGIPAAEVR